jgi:hypothetical protein
MGENGENSESNNNGPRNQSNKPKIPPAEEVETGALEVVRKESREVLKHQIELLGDIDDKAMRTVRTSVLFIGLVISAIQISGDTININELSTWPFRLATGGVTFLLISIVAGIWTYSVSDPDFGVSDGHRQDVVAGGFTKREWLLFQLNEYDEWTDSMSETNENNVVGLHTTLFSLVTGVFALLFSVMLTMDFNAIRLVLPIVGAVVIVLLVTVVLWMTRR